MTTAYDEKVYICACGHSHKAAPDCTSEPCQHCPCPSWRDPPRAPPLPETPAPAPADEFKPEPCVQCGKEPATKVGGLPWLCRDHVWAELQNRAFALIAETCKPLPAPAAPSEEFERLVDALRRTAYEAMLAAFDGTEAEERAADAKELSARAALLAYEARLRAELKCEREAAEAYGRLARNYEAENGTRNHRAIRAEAEASRLREERDRLAARVKELEGRT